MRKPPNLSQASDHDVLERARQGDQDACREIVRRYGAAVYDRVYRMVGNRELAEDLTQETFVKAFGALERHGPERKPSAWLHQIANNTALDYIRLKRPDSTPSDLTVTPREVGLRARRAWLPGDTPSPNPLLHRYGAGLDRALRRLRPEYRRCLVLYWFQDLTYGEIADMLALPLGTVKSRLSRAKRDLKRMLEPAAGSSCSAIGR